VNRLRLAAVIVAATVATGGVGMAVALAACGSSQPSSPATGSAAADGTAPGGTSGSGYSYYRSMMGGRYGSSMMGGSSYGWMMGEAGYRWMMGATSAPAWMRGSALPSFMMGSGMMGTGHDPGKIMGALFANAPGARVTTGQATRLGNAVPAGASVDRTANLVSFSGASVHLVVLASPPGGRDETLRIAGLTNPAVSVRAGAHVSIELVNADSDTAHGLVITTVGRATSWMPMMTAAPAFTGAALWFLGNPTSAGLHAAELSFTASNTGRYQYICPVPWHARKGMAGSFTVTSAA
jgi:rusticyanin